jgi:hypothetical protein
MPGQIARAVFRALVSMAWGALLGVVYAAVVGTAHVGAYGRWAGLPLFAVGCVLVGVVLGLLGRVLWAVSGQAARESTASASPPASNPPPGPARRPTDDEGSGPGRPLIRPRDRAPRSCSWSGLCRNFASQN